MYRATTYYQSSFLLVTEETDYHSKRKHLVNDEHTDDISGELNCLE